MFGKLYTVFFMIVTSLLCSSTQAEVFHYYPQLDESEHVHVWEGYPDQPFNKMIVSWNAHRPIDGDIIVSVMLKIEDDWSPWMNYMQWSSHGQTSFNSSYEQAHVKVYQDVVEMLDGHCATGYRVRLYTTGQDNLSLLWGLHVSTKSHLKKSVSKIETPTELMNLNVPAISQMTLPHPRFTDLCSPTSTSAVVQYLLKSEEVDPVGFSSLVWDRGFDIYGNWVLNVAQASHELGSKWQCWVAYLDGFEDILQSLKKKIPVVVSVRGPLLDSPCPYTNGHLLVVKGFNPQSGEVLCMDPGFPYDEDTRYGYPYADFVAAWQRGGQVAYLFEPMP